MPRTILIALLALFAASHAIAADPMPFKLRILTYNIHHGEGNDGKVDLPRIAKVIESARPDLVALQEVDKGVERSGRVDQPAELARLTGMQALFAKAIDYGGGDYGQAILSRHPLEHVAIHWLPGEPDREKRIAFAARVTIGERKLLMVTTHLHHNNAMYRERQATAINEVLTPSKEPIILAGDLNANPDSQVLAILKPHWQNATNGLTDRLTFPSHRAEKQIDYILMRPVGTWKVTESQVIDEAIASDHRPLLVEVELTE